MRVFAAGGLLAMAATGALAQPATGYTLVPAPERLTFAGVIADASPEVQGAMGVLILSTLAAAAIWAASLPKLGQADVAGLRAALGRLRIVRSGGAPLGALAASYILMCMFIGMANVRPAPSLSVLAPGWAEASMALMLGLLATTVAVLCERHLEGRIRAAAG